MLKDKVGRFRVEPSDILEWDIVGFWSETSWNLKWDLVGVWTSSLTTYEGKKVGRKSHHNNSTIY